MKKIFLVILFAASGSLAMAERDPVNIDDGNNPPPCHTAALSTGSNVSCYGLANGWAKVTITRTTTNQLKVIWSNGKISILNNPATIDTISHLSAGYYDVQVIDLGTGCSVIDIINITQPALLTTSKTFQNVKCYGESTGSINLSVSGGTLNYSYLWSTGTTTQNLNNIAAGTYNVTVTDLHTCKAYNSVTITQPAQALGQSLISMDPTCAGFSNGWADLTVWGGTTPYIYNWNNHPSSPQDQNNISAGSYHVVITDANNCQRDTLFSLTDPPQLVFSNTSANNNCYGYMLGSIDVSTGGGTPPYTYTWANSDYMLAWSTEDLDSLPNYKYYVTVTDAKGCYRTDSAVISSPPQIVSSIASTNVTSFGGINGSINLTVTGGVTPYTFFWSPNGSSNQNLIGIPAGWYHVLITDLNGCTHRDSVFISEPLSALVVDVTTQDVTCFGGSNGGVSAIVAGGTPPYKLVWSTNDSTEVVTGISAGIYYITVTDFFGNSITDTAEVFQPDAITFSHNVTEITCFGLSNGSIDITVAGGTPPYYYEWLNSEYVLAALTEDIAGMPADQYYVEVTDTLGCTGSISIGINQPAPLGIHIDHTNAYCAGSATGTADCIITGGTLPYNYIWSGGQQTPGITDLTAGTYYVTVTDSNSCFVTDSILITQVDSVKIDYTITPVSCIDQHDGRISITAYGGNGNFSYLWSNGATVPDLEELYAGDYAVTVTDMMGCTGGKSLYVSKIEVDCINIPSCFTPNGDGLNDIWHIKDAELYPEFYLEVFNRWGQSLYKLQGSFESWDGNYKGKPLPAETYYYFLRLTSQSPMIQGTITIVR
jgi:gliding motility-associated-like protein